MNFEQLCWDSCTILTNKPNNLTRRRCNASYTNNDSALTTSIPNGDAATNNNKPETTSQFIMRNAPFPASDPTQVLAAAPA